VKLVTIDLPPGLVSDDTEFTTPGWKDCNNFRFWRGRAEVIGGWESFSTTALTGVCRSIFDWFDADSLPNFAFGCHNGLTVWQAGDQADVTPVATSATATITITGTPVANETFVVGAQTFTFKASRTGAGEVAISAVNNTQAANIVTAITADLATVTAVANANVVTLTVVATGFAGNSTVLTESATGVAVTPFSGGAPAFVAGQIDGTGVAGGYGTGAYGIGDWGEASSTDYFPMTCSFGSRDGRLYANPRRQTIWVWENNTAVKAVPLRNAPQVCNFMLVAYTGQVMAFGCSDLNNVFTPSNVRISDAEDPTIWTPASSNTAQQYQLEGNGRIVGAMALADVVYIWTDSEVHEARFNGEWSFRRIASGCGLAGPNAPASDGQTVYWPTGGLQFFGLTLGGTPQLMTSTDGRPCPVRQEFKDNAASGQNDKIVGFSTSERGEVAWSYADARDGNGYENSRIIRFSTVDGAWSRSELARTAYSDAEPSPVATTFEGQIYYHERGNSADGAAMAASIASGGQYIDPAQRHVRINGWRPDLGNQTGTCFLTIYTRRYPQGAETTWGPYAAPAGTEKVDFRVDGLIFRFELSGESSPLFMRVGKQTFDFELTGER
jgi:hypothetical protein